MHRVFLFLVVLPALAFAGGCTDEQKKSVGALPVTDTSDTSAPSANATPVDAANAATDDIWRAISKAYADGTGVYRLAPGTYRLKPPAGEVSCLPLRDMKNFTLDFTGSTFVVPRENRFLLLEDCDGIKLKGGTVTRAVPAGSQGRIESIGEDRKSVKIQICEGYPADIDNTTFFPRIPIFNVVDPESRRFKPGVPDIYITRVERTGPTEFRFHLREILPADSPLQPGDYAAWRGYVATDVALRFCRTTVVEDMTIKGAAGMVFQETCGHGGNRFARCLITYGERPSGATINPLLASNADGFHSSSMRTGFTLEDCHTEGLDDDAVAIHGAYAMVTESRGNTVILDSRTVMAQRSGNHPFCAPGDRLRVYDTTAARVTEATVRSVKQLAGYTPSAEIITSSRFFKSRAGALYWEVELEQPADLKPGWFVANTNALGSDFVIRNCSMKNQRARAMFLRAHNGVVEDCTIEGTLNAAILVMPEVLWWNESDYVRNLTLRRNTIRGAGLANQPFAGAVTVAAYEHGAYVTSPHGHEGVIIEDNTFENNDGINLLLSSSTDVQIRRNRFIRPMHVPARKAGTIEINYAALIWIAHTRHVTMENNRLQSPGSCLEKVVDRVGDVTGSGFEDIVREESPPNKGVSGK